jgi:hypothetical protein
VSTPQNYVPSTYCRDVIDGESLVRLTDVTTVLLADGMYSFCELLRYAYDGQPAAGELIAAVLEHPRYHDMFITRWTGPQRGVHGPYRLETLSVEGFEPCSVATAIDVLNKWPASHLNPWVSHEMIESQEIVAAWTSPLILAASEIYHLTVPREGNEHDCGWICGTGGFHEFIAFDRPNNTLTVIIGTDD